MSTSTALSNRSILFYILALGVVSAHFSVAYITNTSPYVDLAAYTAGNERLPYQYRALTSWILSLLTQVQALRSLAQSQPAPFNQPEVMALTFLVVPAVMVATDFTRRSIKLFIGDCNRSAILAFCLPIALYFSYVALASTYRLSFAYDIPNIAVFAVCVYGILSRRHGLFYMTFLLATASRETSVFLIVMFVLYNRPSTRRALLHIGAHCLALFVIWFVVKLSLVWLYAGNPTEADVVAGGLFQLWPKANLEFWTNPKYWPGLLSSFSFLWIAILAGWKYIGDPDLKRTLWLTVVWFVGMFLVAKMTEVRLFGELTTLLSVITAVIIHNYFSRRERLSVQG